LSPRRPDSWAAASVQQFELNARRVYGFCHNSAERADFAYEMPFGGAAHGRIARHVRHPVSRQRAHANVTSQIRCRERRFNARARYPTFDELMGERDRMLMKHPDTTFILAHMGWHANDLARLGKLFDKLPNLHAEVGAVLYDLGRQPRFGHDFFVKYQNRILFGKDSFQPDEYPYFWRVFETADEYFDYYRDYHAFWKLYGMNLPDAVLKKLYYQNAVRIVPGLPTAGLPR
jgi:hypothetical protein